MKNQTTLLLVILFALIVALFAVVNVNTVTVNYVFGQAEWPLVMVILFSVLMGGLISGLIGIFRTVSLKRQNHVLIDRIEKLKKEIQDRKEEKRDSGNVSERQRTVPDGDGSA
ncbi:LapA family protein [Bacillus thermotolerans]|uniref:Lipopolysaccharide assembly protein A domain-containing protein n=1 Tax=Bacillus thermotolerans TaxID=1221996 RepID=A0A0F5ICX6_BACTR|nr:lipopolysaccharide assembly protein LapA domain-containing protein [Bacillus thermotolerans]KKB34559.1 hypothetical protein QY97_02287 [Bacillus thermotolerans]KKB39681.1 hypothetical protein QY96_02769 [Bacillus thermotolerans]KKB43444.1 hypothetical protein QY95_01689 [Bacillus thermotolerans]